MKEYEELVKKILRSRETKDTEKFNKLLIRLYDDIRKDEILYRVMKRVIRSILEGRISLTTEEKENEKMKNVARQLCAHHLAKRDVIRIEK